MLILSEAQVAELLDLDQLIEALAIAMQDISTGKASTPARIGARVEDRGLLGAMPGYCPSLGVLEAKLVTVFPHNIGKSHQGVIVAFDPITGSPTAIMDAAYITAIRTACGSALSAKLLSREEASVLAILGTGVQAFSHARAIPRVRRIREIRVAGRSPEKANGLAKKIESEIGIPAKATATWEESSLGADIVCATTHPLEPVLRWEWLSAGAHATSVGNSAEGIEAGRSVVLNSRVFVEQRSAATAAYPTGGNDLHGPLADGAIKMDDITEIGEVIAGTAKGRTSADEVTLYKSVGIAVQDAAAVWVVLKAARERSS